MTYLVDANVLSEPTKRAPSAGVVHWLRAHEREIAVDAIVLGELTVGVLALPDGRKRKHLERWLAALVDTIECLPWDATVSQRWAALVVDLRRRGQTMPLLDGMIAATALRHGLKVVTRNVGDFAKAGVEVVDPFS